MAEVRRPHQPRSVGEQKVHQFTVASHWVHDPANADRAAHTIAGQTLFDIITATALVPAVVDREHLQRAYARLTGGRTAANVFVDPPAWRFRFEVASAVPFTVGAVCRQAASGRPIARSRRLALANAAW